MNGSSDGRMWSWAEGLSWGDLFVGGLFGPSVSTKTREAHFPTLVEAAACREPGPPREAYAALGRCDPLTAEDEVQGDLRAEAAAVRAYVSSKNFF